MNCPQEGAAGLSQSQVHAKQAKVSNAASNLYAADKVIMAETAANGMRTQSFNTLPLFIFTIES